MKKTNLFLLSVLAACSGGTSSSDTARDLASGERIADVPGPLSIHASGQSQVVVTIDASAPAGVGTIPEGAHVQLGGGTLHVDGHGSVELRVRGLSDLQVTGHSSVEVHCLKGGALSADASGQSSVELSGALDGLDARATGGSSITGQDLTVTHASQDARGHSTIDLTGSSGNPPSCEEEKGGAGGSGGSGGDGGSGTGGSPLG